MKNILEKIVAQKVEQEKHLWEKFDRECDEHLKKIVNERKNNPKFCINSQKDLQKNHNFYLIAECKKTSPSKGRMSEKDYDPNALASAYEKAGASAISVLCEKNYFEGSLEHLQNVAQMTDLPLLQKDFIVHEKQLFDGLLAGASMSLFILRILPVERLCHLIDFARRLGMGYLIEIYGQEDVEKAQILIEKKNLDRDDACLIGINNRDLVTFQVDFQRSIAIKKELPSNLKIISESGIEKKEDLQTIADEGFFGALVGEMLMKSENQEMTLRHMLHSLKTKK